VDSMRARAAAVKKAVAGTRPPRVMYELDASDPARPYVAGSGGFYGELMTLAGGRNVFGDLPDTAVQVSSEQVVARNPEVVLLGDTNVPKHPQRTDSLRGRPGWAQVEAVRKGQVYAVDYDRITRPGPRLIEGLEELAKLLHPDRFR
jgi:iron complex transport system substrate-binding protein